MTAPTKPTEDLTWADTSLTNGANNTQNKVEPSADHKDKGWSFPEQPPRNYWNYWMNGVWKWFTWATKWIDNAGRLADQFAQNADTTTGLVFGYFGGKLEVDTATGGSATTIAGGTFSLAAASTTHVYISLADGTINQVTTGVPSITEGSVILYEITTDGSAITSVVDRRTFSRVLKRASSATTITGTDANSFVTPAGLASLTTLSTRSGLIELATQGEVDAGIDAVRAITPATLKNAADIMRRDGSVVMTGDLDLGDNALILRNDGGSDKNYLEFNNGTNEFNLVDTAALGATGNATLNLGKTVTTDLKCTKVVGGSVGASDEFYMRDPATNLIKPVTKQAVRDGMVPTESVAGLAEIAAQAEVDLGTDDVRYVTPLKLSNKASQIIHIQDQKAYNTDGGTFTAGAWRTRDLNTIISNGITGASLSVNQVALPAGTYEINARAPAYGVDNHKARIYDITNAVQVILGSSARTSGATDQVTTDSVVRGIITLAGTTVLELQHQCLSTITVNGFGASSGFAGVIEVYSDVFIKRLH